jgi:hypothetical protein
VSVEVVRIANFNRGGDVFTQEELQINMANESLYGAILLRTEHLVDHKRFLTFDLRLQLSKTLEIIG